jgi:hypothetical protein
VFVVCLEIFPDMDEEDRSHHHCPMAMLAFSATFAPTLPFSMAIPRGQLKSVPHDQPDLPRRSIVPHHLSRVSMD